MDGETRESVSPAVLPLVTLLTALPMYYSYNFTLVLQLHFLTLSKQERPVAKIQVFCGSRFLSNQSNQSQKCSTFATVSFSRVLLRIDRSLRAKNAECIAPRTKEMRLSRHLSIRPRSTGRSTYFDTKTKSQARWMVPLGNTGVRLTFLLQRLHPELNVSDLI